VRVAAKGAFYALVRGLARLLPPDVLYFVLYPYSFARSFPKTRHMRSFPAARIPPQPSDLHPLFLTRWRFQARIIQRWLPLFWADVDGDAQRWTSRISVDGLDRLDALGDQRPIIVMTLHTGGMIVLGGWLMLRGLGIGSVIIDRERWLSPEGVKARSDPRWQKYADRSSAFLAGDARQMVRHMQPGKAFVLQADHLLGRTADATWPGGKMKMAVGGLRIARMTGAVVIPIVVMDDGRWRYRIHIGTALSDELVQGGDDDAAASEIARQLMPIVEKRPLEALPTLVNAVLAAIPEIGQRRS
jgi:lauroyl/myristoyl acyltransferase